MRRAALAAALGLVLGAARAPAAVENRRRSGAEGPAESDHREMRVVALPGALPAIELPRRSDGRLDVVVLLVPEEGALTVGATRDRSDASVLMPLHDRPRTLYRLDTASGSGGAVLEPLLRDVPAGNLGLLDLDGDGSEEVLIAHDGTVLSLGTVDRPSPPRVVLKEDYGSRLAMPSRWADPTGAELGGVLVAAVGRVRAYVPRAGELALADEQSLPLGAARARGGLRLKSPPVAPIGGDLRRLAVGPERWGNRRLASLVLDAVTTDGLADADTGAIDGAGAGDETSAAVRDDSFTRTISLLPGAESVGSVHWVTLDEAPALIVTTTSAERVGIFEHWKLRVFRPARDRTRAGHPPALATQTASHGWSEVAPFVADVDRDGRDDLVVLQRGGLAGGETVIDTFFGRADGGFDTPARRQKWDLRSRGWSWGPDVTGDAIADLVVVEPTQLLVFAGTDEPRKALLERDPLAIAIGPPSAGTKPEHDLEVRELRVVDLDTDGRAEAILLAHSERTGEELILIELR